jgi:hypothetical protein
MTDGWSSDTSESGNRPGTAGSLLPPPRPYIAQTSRQNRGPEYFAGPAAESSEMLLLPSSTRRHVPYFDSPSGSRSPSVMSSRRSSWSSDRGRSRSRDNRPNYPSSSPFISPFDDSRPCSRADSSDDELVNTQTVSEKYAILPSEGLLLYPEDIEKDDWLHNPDADDPDGEPCTIFTKRAMTNIGGLVLITLGILILFVGLPIM